MKKRFIPFILLIGVSLLFSSCKLLDYEAYVTIVNIGNLSMRAAVEGDWEEIAAYDSCTWAISLEDHNDSVLIHVEAEPLIGGDYDEADILLNGDRDVQTWLTGWDAVSSPGGIVKKESRIVKGSAQGFMPPR